MMITKFAGEFSARCDKSDCDTAASAAINEVFWWGTFPLESLITAKQSRGISVCPCSRDVLALGPTFSKFVEVVVGTSSDWQFSTFVHLQPKFLEETRDEPLF